MSDPARKVELPAEIADAMEAAGIPAGVSKLMEIIAEFHRLKEASAKAPANAESVEPMFELGTLLPVHLDYSKIYQKALRAAKSGQLEAKKLNGGGRWFCTKRAMQYWLAKTGQGKR
jgi:hypothetical protein